MQSPSQGRQTKKSHPSQTRADEGAAPGGETYVTEGSSRGSLMAEPHPLAAVPPASKEASPPAETTDGLFSRRRLHDAMRRYVQRCGSTGTANPRAALRLAARIAAITIVLMQFGAFIRRRSAPTRAALIILLASASAQLLSTQATLTASEATAPAAHEPIAAITMENEAVDHNVCGEAASDEAYDPGAAATPSRTSREAVLVDPDHLRRVFECLAPRDWAAAARVSRAWRAAWVRQKTRPHVLEHPSTRNKPYQAPPSAPVSNPSSYPSAMSSAGHPRVQVPMLISFLVAVVAAWPISNHTEVKVVTTPHFSAIECGYWIVTLLASRFALAYVVQRAPAATMAYMAWSVGLSIFLSYHTDTELITETTHDWYEHAVIAGCIFAFIQVLGTLMPH